jgi:hypothetical protein
MTISLYDASVATYLQGLDAAAGFLAKARAHFEAEGVSLDDVVEGRLIADTPPLRIHLQQIAFHSLGAVEAIRAGELRFPPESPSQDYADLQAIVDDTRAALRRLAPEDIDALSGKDVMFNARGLERVFTAESFVLSFSLPNFHFHAATALAILRGRGAPLGKLDYVGEVRLKG